MLQRVGRQTAFFTALFLISQLFREFAGQQCGADGDLYSIYQMMLQGHTYKTFKFKPGTLECREACLADDRCQSYNVVMFSARCELNNQSKEARPEDFVKEKDRYYMTIGRKRECEPVGVADMNIIPDVRMTASTTKSASQSPYYGRLNEGRGRGVWCPRTKSDRTDFLQVDMGTEHSVCAVATQGGHGSPRVTSYKLRISGDGITWITYNELNIEKMFKGNSDRRSVVKNPLGTDAKARYIRFYPATFRHWPCMSVEIYVRK